VSEETLSNLSREERRFEPPAGLAEHANVTAEAYERAERDPEAFCAAYAEADAAIRETLTRARAHLPALAVPDATLEAAARLCLALGTDGLRGELTLMRTARALAALEAADTVGIDHLARIAPAALRHRLRRNPLDESGSTARVTRAVAEVFAP